MIWACLFFASIAAETGKDTYGKETIESLQIVGSIKLNGTTLSKLLKVEGSLIAHAAHLHQVEAVGDIQLFDTTIEQPIHVTGSLKATRSKFDGPLTLLGQRAVFSSCHLEKLTVEKDPAFKGAQIIELKEKTIVEGPIHFSGGHGRILLYPGSRILGPVSGGTITYK